MAFPASHLWQPDTPFHYRQFRRSLQHPRQLPLRMMSCWLSALSARPLLLKLSQLRQICNLFITWARFSWTKQSIDLLCLRLLPSARPKLRRLSADKPAIHLGSVMGSSPLPPPLSVFISSRTCIRCLSSSDATNGFQGLFELPLSMDPSPSASIFINNLSPTWHPRTPSLPRPFCVRAVGPHRSSGSRGRKVDTASHPRILRSRVATMGAHDKRGYAVYNSFFVRGWKAKMDCRLNIYICGLAFT